MKKLSKIIGIPSNGSALSDTISQHFGHCKYFLGVEITEKNKVHKLFSLQNNGHTGCMEHILKLRERNVSDVIVMGIGTRPHLRLKQLGVNIFQGQSVNIKNNVKSFLEGKLKQLSQATCNEHHGNIHGHNQGC